MENNADHLFTITNAAFIKRCLPVIEEAERSKGRPDFGCFAEIHVEALKRSDLDPENTGLVDVAKRALVIYHSRR